MRPWQEQGNAIHRCKVWLPWPTNAMDAVTEGSMSGFKRLMLILAVLLAAFAAGRATAQDAPDIVGTWSGAIALPTGDLTLVLYVTRGADGALGAKIENFEQNPGNPADITEITVIGGRLAFKVAPIGASYEGTWDAA